MKKTKTPTLVTSAVLTLITVLFWAGFQVYRSLTVKPAPTVPSAILSPLDPTLDTASLDNIQSRIFLDDTQIGNNALQGTSVAATSTPIPVATVSAIPVASASATPVSTSSATPVPSPTP